MAKFPTSTDFYYRIKHDPTINPSGIKITYLDSLKKKFVDIDFSKWIFIEDGGDIPIHRIYYFKYNDEIIWNRENKILNLDPIHNNEKLTLPDSFKILSWNVLNQKKTIASKKDQERQDKIVEQISVFLNTIEIICLQEVNEKMLDKLKKNLDNKYNFVSTNLTSGDNIVFITKYFINQINNIIFSSQKECIKITVQNAAGFDINIYGVHLTSNAQTNSSHKRLEQLEELSKHIDLNSTNIICGDFNEENSTHNLLADFYLNQKNETEYSFDPTTNKLAWDNSTTKQPYNYDKIYINGLLKYNGFDQILTSIQLSDHYPIVSHIQIEPNNVIFKPQVKNTTSGLFIIIPPNATNYLELQTIRKDLDDNYSKWMPHLSIHLGWIPETEFVDWQRNNQEMLKKINSFNIELDTPDYFTHDSAYTLILRPNKTYLKKVTNLFKIFGSNSEPHLTLGKFKEKSKLDTKLKLVTDAKISIKWELNKIHLISKKNRDYGIQLGLVKLNGYKSLEVQDILTYLSEQIKQLFPNTQIIIGGSQVYFENYNVNSDLDLLVIGTYDQNNFYSKLNKFFQSNGNFIHSKIISNKFMNFIRAIANDHIETDIHYLETNCTDINKMTEHEQKIKSSVYWDNISIFNYVKRYNLELVFKQGLCEIKKKFKECKIYGQEYCYLGGISLAIMLCFYLKKVKPDKWDLNNFCNFYFSYDFTQSIILDGSSMTVDEPHVFAKIIGPISNYNTSRNLTASTFSLIKEQLNNRLTGLINFEYKLTFSISAPDYYLYDEVKCFIRSIYLKIILTIEKTITNSNYKLYPLSNNNKQIINNFEYICNYEFGFNFNPVSISNIFDKMKNKILTIYPESNAYYFIEKIAF